MDLSFGNQWDPGSEAVSSIASPAIRSLWQRCLMRPDKSWRRSAFHHRLDCERPIHVALPGFVVIEVTLDAAGSCAAFFPMALKTDLYARQQHIGGLLAGSRFLVTLRAGEHPV